MSLMRIHLQLPVPLLARCTSIAGQKGISRAAFVRHTLSTTNIQYLAFPGYRNQANISFSCRVPSEVLQRLDIQAKQYGVSRNGLIRSALEQATRKPLSKSAIKKLNAEDDKLRAFWKKGELQKAAQIYGSRLDDLSPENIVLMARNYIDMGEMALAKNALDIASRKVNIKPNDDLIFAEIFTAKAHVARYQRQLHVARKFFDKALHISLKHDNSQLTASILSQLSTLAELHEQIDQAIYYAELSHERLNIQENITNYIKTYLRLSGLYALTTNHNKAWQYLGRAEELCKQTNKLGKISELHFQTRKGLINLRLGKIQEAARIFTTTLPKQVEANNRKEIYFNLTNLAVIHLTEGNFAQAENLLSQALRIESAWLDSTHFSRTKAYYSLIEATSDVNRAVAHLNGLKRHGEQPEFSSYILNSLQFIFGTASQQRTASNKLHRLATTTSTAATRQAVEHTLQTRQIYPLV